MAKFTDLAGREWKVEVNTWTLKTVREATGFEIARLLNDDMRRLKEVAEDPVRFCEVLRALCAGQHKDLPEEDFMRGMAGDPLEEAFEAFMTAYADFYPSQRGKVLRALARKEKELGQALTEQALKAIDDLTPETAIRTLRDSAGGSPESPGSIPPG